MPYSLDRQSGQNVADNLRAELGIPYPVSPQAILDALNTYSEMDTDDCMDAMRDHFNLQGRAA